jgi:Na+-translocating membrane potential-generating system (MpsC)
VNCSSITRWKLRRMAWEQLETLQDDDHGVVQHEEFMIEHGQASAVRELREHFQQAVQSTFRAAVERATGRRVIGFASHVQLDEPRFAVEIFRLEPHS